MHEFCLPEVRGSLSYNEHKDSDLDFDDNGSTEIMKYFDRKMDIIHLDMGDYEVTLSRRSRIIISRKENIGDDPTFINIIYKKGVSFFDALQLPRQIVTFFELSEGKPLQVAGEAICTAKDANSLNINNENERNILDNSQFLLFRPKTNYIPQESIQIDPIFKIYFQNDREVFSGALRTWLSRREKWLHSYWILSHFIRDTGVYDRSHLLRAMAWFESLPDYHMKSTVSDTQIQIFRRTCRELDAFKSLGISNDRLTQCLNELTRQPLIERFKSAIEHINSKFNSELLGNEIIVHIKQAIGFRNGAAHGSYDLKEGNFLSYLIATCAVETVSLLATIIDLVDSEYDIQILINDFQRHNFARFNLWNKEMEYREKSKEI